jgi:hypothetical protein
LVKIRWSRYSLLLWTLAFTCPIASASTHAQDTTKPAIEKWRPKDGIYAVTGKGFTERCENLGDFSVELGEKTITGDEWSIAFVAVIRWFNRTGFFDRRNRRRQRLAGTSLGPESSQPIPNSCPGRQGTGRALATSEQAAWHLQRQADAELACSAADLWFAG